MESKGRKSGRPQKQLRLIRLTPIGRGEQGIHDGAQLRWPRRLAVCGGGETDRKGARPNFSTPFTRPRATTALYAMLIDEPGETGDARSDPLMGAVADYLAIQFTGKRPPKWTSHARRVLAEPLFTSQSQAPATKVWLVHNSPAELKGHNIFTESHPLSPKIDGQSFLGGENRIVRQDLRSSLGKQFYVGAESRVRKTLWL